MTASGRPVARPRGRDRAPEEGAQRGHPRALLPGRRDPGRRRLHRRLAPARAGGREDEGRRHLLRGRPLHGRDGEDPEPGAHRRRCRISNAGCSLADGCPADRFARVAAQVSGRGRRQLHQLLGRGEGALRLHLTSSNAEKIVAQHPGGQDDPLRARQEPRPLPREEDRAQDASSGRAAASSTRPSASESSSALKERHPAALVIAHPECEEPVLAMADFIGSTTALLKYAVVEPGDRVHRRDRARHPAPDAEGGARQDVHPGAARGELRVQRVPVHEDEHAREGVPRSAT